jgi:hypothetical protein
MDLSFEAMVKIRRGYLILLPEKIYRFLSDDIHTMGYSRGGVKRLCGALGMSSKIIFRYVM